MKMALSVLIAAAEHGAAPPAILGPLAEVIDNGLAEDAGLTNQLSRLRELYAGPARGTDHDSSP